MTAVKDILEVISAIIPFLERYPGWVKAIVGAWLVLTVVMVISFILLLDTALAATCPR